MRETIARRRYSMSFPAAAPSCRSVTSKPASCSSTAFDNPTAPAAEHRDRAAMSRRTEIDGEFRGSPRQRDPAAAVAVVVDDERVADLLRAHDETRRPIRTQPDHGADFAIRRNAHGRQPAGTVDERCVRRQIVARRSARGLPAACSRPASAAPTRRRAKRSRDASCGKISAVKPPASDHGINACTVNAIDSGSSGFCAITLARQGTHRSTQGGSMTIGTILLIVLILALIGALPTWGYSRSWGYGPTGGLGLIVMIVLILLRARLHLRHPRDGSAMVRGAVRTRFSRCDHHCALRAREFTHDEHFAVFDTTERCPGRPASMSRPAASRNSVRSGVSP